jgi:hypothetical protein
MTQPDTYAALVWIPFFLGASVISALRSWAVYRQGDTGWALKWFGGAVLWLGAATVMVWSIR